MKLELNSRVNVSYTDFLLKMVLFIALYLTNLGTALLIKSSNVYFVNNTRPFGLSINYFLLVFLMLFVSIAIIKLKLLKSYPIFALLILSGVWSNLSERFIYGYVADYINLGFGFANLADFEIWTGVIVINILIWNKVMFASNQKQAKIINGL